MKEKFAGQALALGNNIDTDQIYPGRYLALTNPEEIGSHCLEGVDEGIAPKISKGRNHCCGKKSLQRIRPPLPLLPC